MEHGVDHAKRAIALAYTSSFCSQLKRSLIPITLRSFAPFALESMSITNPPLELMFEWIREQVRAAPTGSNVTIKLDISHPLVTTLIPTKTANEFRPECNSTGPTATDSTDSTATGRASDESADGGHECPDGNVCH